MVAAANPLRSVKGDADYVATVLNNIQGPVVLVAHSYSGMVITNAATGHSNVQVLVYVDVFAPDAGEINSSTLRVTKVIRMRQLAWFELKKISTVW